MKEHAVYLLFAAQELKLCNFAALASVRSAPVTGACRFPR